MIRLGLTFPLPLSFFGLQPKDKATLHKNIFALIHHGQGFTFRDVYDMPIYLRNFYTKELIDLKDSQKQAIKDQEAENKTVTPMSRFPRK